MIHAPREDSMFAVVVVIVVILVLSEWFCMYLLAYLQYLGMTTCMYTTTKQTFGYHQPNHHRSPQRKE